MPQNNGTIFGHIFGFPGNFWTDRWDRLYLRLADTVLPWILLRVLPPHIGRRIYSGFTISLSPLSAHNKNQCSRKSQYNSCGCPASIPYMPPFVPRIRYVFVLEYFNSITILPLHFAKSSSNMIYFPSIPGNKALHFALSTAKSQFFFNSFNFQPYKTIGCPLHHLLSLCI